MTFTDPAQKLCDEIRTQHYDDWGLPLQDEELTELFETGSVTIEGEDGKKYIVVLVLSEATESEVATEVAKGD